MKIHPRQWAFCLLTVLLLAGMGSPTLQTTNAPNSFDIYVDAGEQLVRDKDIGDVYVNADGQGTLIRKRALVQDNQRALSRVRQGFAFAYRNPPIRSLDATMPYFTKYRSLVRLLAMESEVYAADGNYTQAVLCGLDAMHLGKDVPHGSVTIGALVGLKSV